MNERWKYQVRVGGIWGIFMIIFSTGYIASSTTPLEVQLADYGYYLRAMGYIVFGIFVLGYSSWTAKRRREGK